MEKKVLKVLWVINLVIVIISALAIINHAFNIVTLPDDLFKIISLLNIMALIGYFYTNYKLGK